MATLKDRLNKDLVVALKARDENKVATLRFLNSAIHNKEIDKRAQTSGGDELLTDEETLAVLKNEAKKRKEAIELYDKGGRADLSGKEKSELEIIEEYLPAELNDGELEKIVAEVFEELGRPQGGPVGADFGKVMGVAMKKVGGRASGDRVKEFIQRKLT
ncbi:MAG: GatB/YqeY domain-containing protein [Candidatus Jorgensenbacteria bacterium]